MFNATADDGVAWTIDGAALFGPEAWSMHPATPYTGTMHLSAGWHATEIRYMQGIGASVLNLSMAPKGQGAAAIPIQRLRSPLHHLSASELLAGDPQAVAVERLRQAASLTRLSAIARRLKSLSPPAGDQLGVPLDGMSTQLDQASADDQAGRPGTSATPEALLVLAAQVQAAATTVRTALAQQQGAGPAGVPSPELAEPAVALARMHERLAEIALLPADACPCLMRMRCKARWRSLVAIDGWVAQLRRELPRCRWRLLAQSRAQGEEPRAMRETLAASRTLGAMAAGAEALHRQLALVLAPAAVLVVPADLPAQLQAEDEALGRAEACLVRAHAFRLEAAGATAMAHLQAIQALRASRPLAAGEEGAALLRDWQRAQPLLGRDDPQVAMLRRLGEDPAGPGVPSEGIIALSAWPPAPVAPGSYALDITEAIGRAAREFTRACAPPALATSEATASARLEAAEAAQAITAEVVATHPGMPGSPQRCLGASLACERFARAGRLPERFAELAQRVHDAFLDPAQDGADPALALGPADQARHAADVLTLAAQDPGRRAEARTLLAQLSTAAPGGTLGSGSQLVAAAREQLGPRPGEDRASSQGRAPALRTGARGVGQAPACSAPGCRRDAHERPRSATRLRRRPGQGRGRGHGDRQRGTGGCERAARGPRPSARRTPDPRARPATIRN